MNPIAARNVCGVVALALAACSAMTQDPIEAREDPERRPSTALAPEARGSQAMQAMLEQIRADAARRTGAQPDAVKLVSVEAVTWSDGSLGCPEPGMMYTQALVPGHRIIVDAGGTPLAYHANARGGFVQCPPDRALAPVPGDSV